MLLPLQSRSANQTGETSAESIAAPDTLEHLDVLLVEDDPAARETTAQLLGHHGAAVRQASSAAEARAAFEARRPQVIVADIDLPQEDGYTLPRGLRRTEQEHHTPRVPALAVTAFARSEDRERAFAAGFDEYLPKAVDPQRLVALLALLAAKRARESES